MFDRLARPSAAHHLERHLRAGGGASSQFSQVDYKVQVAYTADVALALGALKEEAAALASERSLPPPDVLGVQRLAPGGVTLRVQLRTPPLQQYAVERELNRRVKLRFDREGVEFARWTYRPESV